MEPEFPPTPKGLEKDEAERKAALKSIKNK